MLRVVVLDVNDNPPTFERTSYYTAISEAARVDTVVARVRASSLDIGANAAITYTIAAGNQQGKFVIGAKDGEEDIFPCVRLLLLLLILVLLLFLFFLLLLLLLCKLFDWP